MFSHFDGQYRSTPRVSLRGASKQEEKNALLQRTHREREEREMIRKRLAAAVSIQAVYRGHRDRQIQYAYFRAKFDGGSHMSVFNLSRLLIVFYSEKRDHERLVSLGQKWLKSRRTLAAEATTNCTCALHLSRILLLSSLSLCRRPDQRLAIPLRMLEFFLSPENYASSPTGQQFVGTLTEKLIENGYFLSLRRVLEVNVPTPDNVSTTPLLLTTSLLDNLTRPLLSAGGSRHLPQFTRDLLAPPLSPHVAHLLLPHLSSSPLSPASLIEASYSSLLSHNLSPSHSLLYCILTLVHHNLHSISLSSFSQYLHLLSLLLPPSPPPSSQHTAPTEWVRSEDDIEWAGHHEEDFDPLGSPEELLACCLSKVVDKSIPLRLRRNDPFPPILLRGLSSLVHQLLQLWGRGQSSGISPVTLFHQLSISSSLLPPLWAEVETITVQGIGQPIPALRFFSRGGHLSPSEGNALVEHLSTFSTLFTLYLSSLHDAEFYGETEVKLMPFSLAQLVDMVAQLRDVFITLHMEKFLPFGFAALQNSTSTSSSSFSSRRADLKPSRSEYRQLKECVYDLLCSLRERDSRRQFCPNRHWEAVKLTKIPPELFLEDPEEVTPTRVSASVMKTAELLQKAPFVFSFEERVQFFHILVRYSRQSVRGGLQEFLLGPSLEVTARRNHIYADAFSELSQGKDLRLPLRVRLVNAQGLDEPGVDGGGLFREFLSELLRTGFDPNHGYFTTTQDGLLYPSPQVHLLTDDFKPHYHFLGAMLGKALYENLLVELPFAGFFLCKLTGRGRGLLDVYHLSSLDPELYRQLLSLKHYQGDVEELELNFTTLTSHFGHSQVVELRPGGAGLRVTSENCVQYIHLMAHWRLNVSIEEQFRAFRQGVDSVVPLQWLRLFSQRELQVLISGAEVAIDISDLKDHTKYAGEYMQDHETILQFWKVVEGFSETEKQQLLKFVTSCSRPPLLGFKDLFPQFCVMSGGKDDRLPSASTCMNLLKLPIFPDIKMLQSRLKYAISSGAGFELS